jgi:hypothetical protein
MRIALCLSNLMSSGKVLACLGVGKQIEQILQLDATWIYSVAAKLQLGSYQTGLRQAE